MHLVAHHLNNKFFMTVTLCLFDSPNSNNLILFMEDAYCIIQEFFLGYCVKSLWIKASYLFLICIYIGSMC